MKRATVKALAWGAVALGVLRLLDLLLFTEGASGFVTLGSVWVRYMAVLGYFLLLRVLTRLPAQACTPEHYAPAAPWLLWLLAALGAAAGAVTTVGAVQKLLRAQGIFGGVEYGIGLRLFAFLLRLALGVSLLVFGAWCAVLARRNRPIGFETGLLRSTGFVAVVGFLALPLLRYADNPATVSRITHTLPIFSGLAALYFAVKLLGVVCTVPSAEFARSFYFAGLGAFYLNTCMELPQTVWQFAQGEATVEQLLLSAALGALGAVGVQMALRCEENRAVQVAAPELIEDTQAVGGLEGVEKCAAKNPDEAPELPEIER